VLDSGAGHLESCGTSESIRGSFNAALSLGDTLAHAEIAIALFGAAAWEAASADLRTAINAEVDELVQRLGVATPPTDTTPGTGPAEGA
jgi:hypothetical protein